MAKGTTKKKGKVKGTVELKPTFETDTQLQTIAADIPKVQQQVADLIISDTGSQAIAVGMAGTIKTRIKLIEEKRKEFSVPLNKMLKALNDNARTAREPLEQMEVDIKVKLGKYQEELEAKQREAEAKRQEEIRKADEKRRKEEDAKRIKEEELAAKIRQEQDEKERARLEAKLEKSQDKPVEQHAPPPPPKPVVDNTVKSNGAAATFKKIPCFEIFNPGALSRDWLMPDEKKIRAAVNNGTREIMGVRIWEKTNTSIRGGS